MPKDKKSKAAEKKARVAQKTEKKAAQKEKKASKKPKASNTGEDSDAEESVDLDAVLAEYARQQEQFLKVTETICNAPPSARGSASFIGSPANDNELFLYGGEYFNGALAKFYNDLFVYNINRDEWKLVTSPNSPLPRSGHAWCRGGNAGGIYLFGGEFSSPKQGTFYHYNDFWRLEPSTREWTKLEGKGKGQQGPPARSGHRMTYFKNYIVLFGGFQDTSQQTKYLSDIWVYDCQNFMWHNPSLPPASQKPEPRSSFSFLPHESGAVLYGGYSRVKMATVTRSTKGSRGAISREVYKPLVHQDTWFLRITPPASDALAITPPTLRWERRKRPVNAPNPPRAGATMAYHRGRGIQFGGVHDVEKTEEGIDSEFFNTLYVWNIDRNRYFSLALRRPRTGKKQSQAADRGRRGRGKANEEELLKNLAALEMQGSITATDDAAMDPPPEEEYEAADSKPEKLVMWEMPHPRFNAHITVQDDVLYIFGGTFEKGDQEFTFDEMWAIDLGKLDGVREIFRRDLEDWQGSDEDESEDEDDEDDESSDDEGREYDETGDDPSRVTQTSTSAAATEPSEADTDVTSSLDEVSPAATSELSDARPHPRPFESLRAFYARTSQQWQEVLLEELKKEGIHTGKSVKEVRKGAFELAEQKWWDCREEIQALEDEQEDAGIGEVVSLADKSTEAMVGAGRRR